MPGSRDGVFSGSRRSTVAAAQLIHVSAWVLVWPGGMAAAVVRTALRHCQAGGVAPCRFLCFEVPDAVCLGALDAGLFHGGFPVDALLACRFDFGRASAFGGCAAERDLLGDLRELVFEGACDSVGPFAGSEASLAQKW
jgi:hypothetical protein